MTDSWWLKLDRAEQHFAEFQSLIAPWIERCVNPVSKGWETEGQQSVLVYRVRFANSDPDERLAVIAGDIMFNVRSALDHIAVAAAPPNRKYQAAFPIMTCNPFEQDEITGNYLHVSDHAYWERCTRGMRPEIGALIGAYQPYRVAADEGQDPEDHALALLSTFQNADKHRELVIVDHGLADFDYIYRLPNGLKTILRHADMDIPPDRLLQNRAKVHVSEASNPPEMEMEIEGAPQIVVGRAVNGPLRGCPGVFAKMIDTAKRVVGDLTTALA